MEGCTGADSESAREVRERLEARVLELEGKLAHLDRIRLEERRGRTRAEAALGDVLKKGLLEEQRNGEGGGGGGVERDHEGNDGAGEDEGGFISRFMRPVAVAETCFHGRRGTPRQSLLVPSALCRMRFAKGVHAREALDGIEQFSHVWVIFVFHLNTNFHRAHKEGGKPPGSFSLVRSKVAVPRLDGGKMGLFATRTPHRPCPVGLSVAKVERVEEDGSLVLSGLDLVDGTPILDVKPYVPFCDCLPGATAPWWVDGSDAAEPIQGGREAGEGEDNEGDLVSVAVEEACRERLEALWTRRGGPALVRGLYPNCDDVLKLVGEILGRDIRSLHQRGLSRADGRATKANAARQSKGEATGPSSKLSKSRSDFQLTLGTLKFMYRFTEDGTVCVFTVDHLDDIPEEPDFLSLGGRDAEN